MRRILFLLFTVFSGLNSYSQPITVNTTTYTVPQLVQDVLFAPSSGGSSSCVGTVSNITWSTGTDYGSTNGIGYFTNTNPSFPLASGVILSTGNALSAPGPNSATQSNGTDAWPGDQDLTDYMSGLGIIDPSFDDYHNASILEFDFVPLTNQMSFDFLFASEEYGTFQCTYSDAFAFFLTNVTTGTPAVNLALVPSTTTPISVTTIRDDAGLPTCGSSNIAYFGSNNEGGNAGTAAINFNGQTTMMTATSAVIPNNTYHIKLVISDLNDNSWDSAVFLGGGSFDIGTADISGTGSEFGGLVDFSGANAICGSKTLVVQAGSVPIPGATYAWTLGVNPVGTNSYTYTITQAGTYGITITYPGGCQQTDSMVVEYLPSLTIGNPTDLTECAAPFDLTDNTPVIQNGLTNPVKYYHTLIEAQQVALTSISNSTNYNGVDGEVIYAAVEDDVTGCILVKQFTLHIDPSLCIVLPIPGTPPDLYAYETTLNSGVASFNFNPQTTIIYGSNVPADYTVTYYLTLADGNAGTNPITNISAFLNTSNPQRIYAVLSENAQPTNFAVTSFQLIVVALPTVSISGPAAICSGTSATITFTGTPNAIVNFTENGTPRQITLNPSGTNTYALPLTLTTVYNLVSATITTPAGTTTQPEVGSVTVTIVPVPTATISGTTAVCQNTPNPSITWTGSNGIAPYTFTYLAPDGSSHTISTTVGNSVNLAVSTALPGVFTYQLVSVAGSGATVCSQPQTGSVTVTVNPTPAATISGTTSVCLNEPSPQITLTGSNGTQPYTFTYSINTVVQPTVQTTGGNTVLLPVPTSAVGTFTYALISVSDGSSTACSQAQAGSAVVTVNVAPVINTPTDYVVCDDSLNNDGVYCFTLTSKDPEISSDPNVVITYHETLTNSQTGANPLTSPYCNINHSGLMTIYVRAYTIGAPACYSNTSFDLIVNPIPIPNPVITDYALCDYNNPGDQTEVFDLGTKSSEIANGQPNVTVSYYATLADAQNQTGALPNFYPNTSNPQQLWINIKDNTTGCNTTGSFNLIVNPLPFVTQPQTLFECSNGLVLTAVFDLTINEGVVTSNVTGLTVSYYHTLTDAQTATSPIPTPDTYLGFDTEIVYIRVENTTTGCYATTTQLLRVTQGPVALTPQPLQYCDPNNDGFGVFTLEDASNEITGTAPGSPLPPGVSVTYHETPDDAFIGANALTSPYSNIDPWSQIIYVRVFYTLTGCANYVQLKLNVNPTPEATTPQPYELCDYTGAVGYEAFNLNTIIPEILGSIDPALNTVSFYITLADAQAGTGAIPNPGNYTNVTPNTQTIYVRVETIATGCYDTVELQLIVNPLPNSTQPNYPQYSLCDNDQTNIGYEVFDLGSRIADILLGQTGMDVTFYDSLGDAQNGTGLITNLMYQNQIQYVQTLGIRITNSVTGCYVISTMDIRVEPLPVLIPPTAPYTLCDDNQDGFTTFDLTTLLPGLLNGITTYTVTFHETLADANSNGTTIPNPAAYINIHPFVQIIYVRAEDNATHCISVIPIELNVNPSPIAPIALDNIVVCDDDSNPQDAITAVNLTQRTPDVLAQQPLAASSYTVTYYNSLTAAQQGPIAAIINDTNYTGTNGNKIWVRVENNITGCFNIGSFDLEINIPLLLITPAPLSLCDDDANPNNQYHEFDLTVKDDEIRQNLPGYTVTYYPSLSLAQAGGASTITDPTAYVNVPPAVQTLGVVVTSAAGCTSITTLDIRVLPIPTPNTNPPALAPKCDDTNPGDMVEIFDLTVNEAYIRNGDPNLTFSYYLTQADAAVPQNPIPVPTAASVGSNVWIRVENTRVDYLGHHCYVLVEQALTVNPLPTVVQPLPPFRACDDNADGFTVFNLADPLLAPQILGASQATADYTITYYLTPAGANPLTNTGEAPLPSSYTNATATTQTIYIRVTNNATGCVNATGVLDLVVEDYATATSPPTYTLCDEDPNAFDGVIGIDLNQFTTTVLGGQNPAIFLISYYDVDPTLNPTAVPLTAAEIADYQAGPDTDTVWAMVENSSNSITPFCSAVAPINIVIERRPDPQITTVNGMTTICVNYADNTVIRPLTLDSGITNPADYIFEWYLASDPTTILGAGSTYTVADASAGGAPRDYVVHVTNNFGGIPGCDYTSDPFTVIQSGPAVIAAGAEPGYVISEAFSDHQSITVNVVGFGTYEYSLDDGPRQTSNVFTNVTFEPHVIHVWDVTDGVANSCEELVIQFAQIIDYPHYFTPNGDGIHDTWNIVGLDGQRNAKIYIFDRYGKLMKQISSSGNGWDGTYNGHLLPADDYWFTVDFIEPSTGQPTQFKAHFSLKR